eukprot:GHVH01000265.1.p1 GENE.GHVH01000265.1~~GHVH01000265.1.p1  ORF type:complete len:101 (-),score=10.81 GHVH01000265.1:866-1129(-)
MMDQKKNQLTKQKYCVNAPAPQTSQPIDPLVSRGTLSYDNVHGDTGHPVLLPGSTRAVIPQMNSQLMYSGSFMQEAAIAVKKERVDN